MINQEDFAKRVKLFTQEAWRRDNHTTLNDMIEFIVRETCYLVLNEVLLIENRLEELENASKDGGLSEPEGSTETTVKGSRRSTARSRE